MWRAGTVVVALVLSACASTEMRGFVGKPVEETAFAYGRPANVIDLPDGRRGYQYRWGGGAVVAPGHAVTTASTVGGVTTATTTATPTAVFESRGCLITFIARDHGHGYVVEEYRVPKQLVC